ncbi:polymorphic toxin-type HINT domain-containing protein [Streptomyces synnematoformans]|uniref:RHS repeat-associated core domain-containing protein n=1 Tax=Streptomyces synnematoformans TaxID=415721 RepID=A0ABN2YDF2_9ACTN
MNRKASTRVRWTSGKVALGAAALMVATLLQNVTTTGAAADDGRGGPGVPRAEEPVAGKSATKVKPRARQEGPRTPQRAPDAAWPEPATARVELSSAGVRSTTEDPPSATALPLTLDVPSAAGGHPAAAAEAAKGARGTVTTRVLGREAARRAGVDGVLFALESAPAPRGAAGEVRATVDYGAFAEAFGGGYASRLTLVEMLACVLDTPDRPGCRASEPVPTVNDAEKQTLTADAVRLGSREPTVLAAVAAEEGGKGDYKATSLAPSSSWDVNLSSGDFSWSYGIPVPEVPGGLQPSVGMSYSSGAVDGRTGGTNNQSSWIGDGFSFWPGYIERQYKPCADDGVKHADGSKPGDLCWGHGNAFISFNGKGGELVPAGNGEWKLRDDDGTRVTRLASAARGNGDNDGEYWRVTDPQGVRYYFGFNRLPGWASGKEATGSAWNVPVFGDDSGEPCHDAAGFGSSWCQQTWRWNLDYVVDPHGNAVAYYYHQEKNSYGRNLKGTNNTRYTRGGTLDRIEYGLKSSSVYGTKPLAKVDFSSGQRCLPNAQTDCSDIGTDAAYWYDTPWDLNCGESATCDQGRYAPSFWTRKRMTKVTTQVLKGDGTYAPVDSWRLTHRWGQADTDYQLLLESIQRTGHTATPAITLPKTTFVYTQLANRLDRTGDGYAPFIKARLSSVADEYGGQIGANYSAPACSWDNLPTPQTNTSRCFPQYIGGSDTADPDRQWFNKYVTTSVTASDRTGGGTDSVTRYEYLGGAAWHYDDDDSLTKEKFKTWSQWRGYGRVRVKTGGLLGEEAMVSQSDTYFLRGMHGDRESPTGGTKNVSVSLGSGEGDPITDHESAAGFAYKTVDFTGPGGKVLNKTVNRPWHHQTAKKERSWGTVTANLTGTAHTKTWTSLDNGVGNDWRVTSKSNTHDTVAGRLMEVNDFADNSTAADNRCTRTTYATNEDKNILTLPVRVETVAKACGDSADRTEDVITDVRTAYDGAAIDATPTPPTRGDATATAVLKSRTADEAVYLESTAEYDAYGRKRASTDLTANLAFDANGQLKSRSARTDGRTSTTAYTPTTGLVTRVEETTPPATPGDATTALTSTTTYDPARGLPLTQADTNGKTTTSAYDALGRTTKVWLPDRRTSLTPNYEFTYRVTEGKPVAVGRKTLGNRGAQRTSYTVFDGFLRERQTQAPGPDGGRLLSDVFYDERGLVAQTFAPYYTDKLPSPELFLPEDAITVETQYRHSYDGVGRTIQTEQVAGSGDGHTVVATTTTRYRGDRTTVIPPDGGTTTTSLVDARGRTTAVRQHHARSAESTYDETGYRYTPRGELEKVTDPAGNSWTYRYDQLGRQTEANDPDKGTTTTVYDDRGQVTSTTDARGTKLVSIYDGMGRQTELRESSPTGTLRADWTYDTVSGAKGHLAASTRYVDGEAYTNEVVAYDRQYRVLRSTVTIPASEGALAGTYLSMTSYNVSGTVQAVGFPKAGALPSSGVAFTYEDETLRPIELGGDQGLKATTSYTNDGKPQLYELSNSGSKTVTVANVYERGTQRLATTRVERTDVPGVDQHNTFTYDDAGNVLSVADVSRSGTDTQCFDYDFARRLTTAWTEGDTECSAKPSGSAVGGPAPYWHSYTYDKSGNRLTETRHDTGGDPAKDTERTYAYPAPGSPRPHSLTSVTSTGPTGTAQDTYTYDDAGNTATRNLAGDTQTLTWDAEGHLAKVTEPVEGGADKVTSYLYDAGGNRLIARTPTETTLYLGATEVTLPKGATTAKATRYYDLGGGHQAVQEDDGSVSFTLADRNGTGQLAVDAATQALDQRRSLPFGAPRGPQPDSWPGTRGFVGGTDDTASTGLQHLGAREYDPDLGRFISVDPLLELDKPQTLNGYTYAAQNPLTFKDPTGLGLDCGTGSPSGVSCGNAQTRADGSRGNGMNQTGGGVMGKPSVKHPKNSNSSPQSPKQTIHITQKDGVVWMEGFRLPSALELERMYPTLSNTDERLDQHIQGSCRPDEITDSNRDFCAIAGDLGWLDRPQTAFDQFVLSIVAPDIGAWKECLKNPGLTRACGSAALDLPWVKVLKPIKFLKAAKTCSKHSFLPGTQVLLADGSSKPIEELEIGDKAVVTDPETGKTAIREIVATINTEDDKDFVDLTIKADDSTTTLTSTTTHPFWTQEKNAWANAGDLTPGQTLRTPDGTTATVTDVRHYTKRQRTHDLTINDIHTYYVQAGETPVLVHNSSCDVSGRGRWQLTKEGSTKLLKGGPFKTTFYKSASDGTWWTPDVTGHGESAFKVYRETSKGLEWISDADKYGDYMPGKWKGDTGKFIPNSNLRGVKR